MLGANDSGRQLYLAVSIREECSGIAWLCGASPRGDVMIQKEGSDSQLLLWVDDSRSHRQYTLLPNGTATDISEIWLRWAQDSGLMLVSLWGWMQVLQDAPFQSPPYQVE